MLAVVAVLALFRFHFGVIPVIGVHAVVGLTFTLNGLAGMR